MAHDVFISYSSKDKTTADAICAVLERDGIRCWIAPRDVTPGHDWAESIIQAIHGSKAFILLFSGFSNTSGQIKREVERAADREIPIIPFRLDDIEPNESLEFFISTPHWMDAFTPPLEGHIRQLSATLTQLIANSNAPAPAAAPTAAPMPAAVPPVAAPPVTTAPPAAAKPGIGSLAPWLIVAALVVVIIVGAVFLLRGHAPSTAPSSQVAAASVAPPQPASAAAAPPSAPATPPSAATPPEPAPQPVVTPQPMAAAPLAGGPSHTCIVADPTPTPLNVRSSPNGQIALTMDNGATVHVIGQTTVGGQSWSQIGSGQSGPLLGWVFTNYLSCS